MKVLVDTHIALWAITNNKQLTEKAKAILLDPENDIYISAVSAWEVDMKTKSKKNNLTLSTKRFAELCVQSGYIQLPLKIEHIYGANELVCEGEGAEHSDPWDRILLTQAMVEGMSFMTHDEMIPKFKQDCVISV